MMGPLVVLSGLAIVVAAGERILLHHQRIIGIAWLGLLLVPPLLTAAAVLLLPPAFGVDLKVAQPAGQLGRFFTENFERRTGRKFALVAGDTRLALLVAAGSPSRPDVLFDEASAHRSPAKREDIAKHGAIVLWPATDSAGLPPPAIKAQFPDLTPEVPHTFERRLQGRRPPLRVGWALIRPQAAQ
jgi:hypothetical protein